jgi:hypothetical protein
MQTSSCTNVVAVQQHIIAAIVEFGIEQRLTILSRAVSFVGTTGSSLDDSGGACKRKRKCNGRDDGKARSERAARKVA